MKLLLLVAVAVLLALVGSAMGWNETDQLTYSNLKTLYQQGGNDQILSQLAGTESGAYFCEPNDTYGNGFGIVANTMPEATDITVNRQSLNSAEDATKADFSLILTQYGTATLTTNSMDSADKATLAAAGQTWTPEISGYAVAGQSLEAIGNVSVLAVKNLSSIAVIGFEAPTNGDAQGTNEAQKDISNWVVTKLAPGNEAKVDALLNSAGMMNMATVGARVSAGINQDWTGTGWSTPTYSGGIDMFATFAGACDPYSSKPIISTVSGSAETSIHQP